MLLVGVCGAQVTVYPITDGNITACLGGFGTSNAGSGGGYENNQDQVATICPDQAGQSIFLTFVAFDLSLDGSAPGDIMVIHDGADVSAPILGTFSDGDLQGQIIAATPDNASGCLTVYFISNEAGTGTFSGVFECGTPCWPPVPNAIVVDETLPAKVCLNEGVTFDASQSQPHPGRTIVDHMWDMRDGTILSGTSVTHQFTESGQYQVSLRVTDDAGCTNTQQTTVAVWVGTEPDFTGTSGNTRVCTNGTVPLTAQVEAVTWNELPTVDLGGQIDLPDQVGQLFTSDLEFNVFPAGAMVMSANDVQSFCVSMEHSFMGDFIISLTCPNGQNMVMHQQGGGGTFLGDANEIGEGNGTTVPGICWDYCFSNSATLGTWEDCAIGGATPNVMPSSQGTSLIPGTYTPVDPFSDLIGCPLNGVWRLNFVDQWVLDNGTMCNWSINFDPSLYPDLTEFTPVIGTTSDSMRWEGPFMTGSSTPSMATIMPTDPGTYQYSFVVTDDFGCTYDTTISVLAYPPPQVTVSSVTSDCAEQAQLSATIIANAPTPDDCTYTLILNDSFGDGWSGGARVVVTVAGNTTNHTLNAGSTITQQFDVPFGSAFTVSYTTGTWNTENSFQFIGPDGVVLYNSPVGPPAGVVWAGSSNCTSAVDPITYSWSPAEGVSAAQIANPTTVITTSTFFTVTAHTTGEPWCMTTDTITVQPPSELENDSTLTAARCHGENGTMVITTTGSGGPWNYRWIGPGGGVVRLTDLSLGDTLHATAGTYQVIISEGGPNANGCGDTLIATITEPTLLEWAAFPEDTTICINGTARLAAIATGGTAPIGLIWDQDLIGNGPHFVSPVDSTVYTVHARDANDCETPTIGVVVAVLDSLSHHPLEDFEQCSGVPFMLEVRDATGGDGVFEYAWSNTSTTSPTLTDVLLDDGSYCVTVSDGCETPSVTSCVDITVLHTPPFQITADTTLGCRPLQVAFTLRDTTGGAQVVWEFGDATKTETGPLVSHIYNVSSQFDVTTTVTWPNGCVTDTTLLDMVQVIPVPRAEFDHEPDPLTILEPHARFTEMAGPNEVGYAWDFFDFGTSDEPDPEVTFPSDIGRFYPVQLVVWNELGCRDTLVRQIHVEDVFVVHTPNSFTPNGDDLNETFLVFGNDISNEEFELDIFDRWGKVVFSTSNPRYGWDGKVNGQPAEVGVYPWRLNVRSLQTLEKRILYGSVSLIR